MKKKKNDQLIAAAPDLLAACKAIRDRDTDDEFAYDEAFQLVIEAIEKAEGSEE